MKEFEEFNGGCGTGCIATIFKMVIALFFWALIGNYIFENIIEGKYGGVPNAPLGWKILVLLILIILIWRVASKPINYFKRRGYEASETIGLGCLGILIGGGLPAIGVIILIIFMFATGQ